MIRFGVKRQVLLVLLCLLAACSTAPVARPGLGTREQVRPIPQATLQQAEPTGPTGAALPEAKRQPEPTPSRVHAAEFDWQAALLPAALPDAPSPQSLTRYEISVEIDAAAQNFRGQVRVLYRNQENAALDRLYFRLYPNAHKTYGSGSLQVSQIRLEGSAARWSLSVADSVLEVAFPEPVPPGASVQLDLDFYGEVPSDFGGDPPSGYGIYNYSEGVLALSGWYPLLAVYDQDGWNLDPVSQVGDSVYSDMAYYDVRVTTDAGWVLAATGVELERLAVGDRITYHLASGPVRDFFMALSPHYQISSLEVGGTLVKSYYIAELAQGGERALQVAADALAVYSRRFGVYPYRELDVVQGPMRNALAVEYPAIVMVASDLYQDPAQDAFIVAVAHEVAHQWWYNLVGNDVFEDPWLDEGLTTYSSALYYQDGINEASYQGLVGTWLQRYERLKDEGDDAPVASPLVYFEPLPGEPDRPRSYGGVVYTKGALFFRAVRQEIGDDAFFQALRSYYSARQYQVATSQDLLDAFDAAADRSLQALYQAWLYDLPE